MRGASPRSLSRASRVPADRPTDVIIARTFQDALACHPVDVVKTQAHVNKGANAPFIRAVLSQARERGVSSLYRGVLRRARDRKRSACTRVRVE